VQAEIMELLRQLQRSRGTAIVLITHDLGLDAGHADRVLVMYAGRAVEVGRTDEIFYTPRHGYTYGLLDSLPRIDGRRSRRLEPIAGQPPSLIDVPVGCAFHPRCRFADAACTTTVPPLAEQGLDHLAACLRTAAVAAAPAPVGR
jgi:oligopeptide/dipeptide ABC transporter ATP-binding protein